jgi:acetyltransferase-like isoleucine patch superfamily enzyme
MKLRAMGATIGPGLWVDGRIVLSVGKGDINIGKNLRLRSRYRGNLVGMAYPVTFQLCNSSASISIGDNCGFSAVIISSRSLVKIGNNVILGGNVRIFDHDYHSLNPEFRRDRKLDSQNVRSSPVVIENDVFIGTSAVILKGVHIGARSIIGAGSVVSIKNIPPDSMVTGNPARIIEKEKSVT